MIETLTSEKSAATQYSRRRFLGFAGALAGAGILAAGVAGCKKTEDAAAIDLGSGDPGVLNYAYALEQLEAAFYTRVISKPYIGITKLELTFLTEIRDHEIAHREFFKNALGAAAIPELDLNLSSIDFDQRTSVLSAAQSFEDYGVSAYNGAGQLISSDAYLTVAGKIVSVEARHAAAIRDLIQYGSFADSTIIGNDGLDAVRSPADVIEQTARYFNQRLNGANLPKS